MAAKDGSSLVRRVTTAGFLLAVVAASVLLGHPWPEVAIAAVGLVSLGEWFYMCRGRMDWPAFILGTLYIAFAGLSAVYIQYAFGLKVTFWILCSVWAVDILGFFVGPTVGGKKLAPQISPHKTWAGAFGGIVGAILVSMAFQQLGLLGSQEDVLLSAILMAIGAIIGDLLMSWFKRRSGVKDSSQLLPGHGGMLDRVDALLMVWFGSGVLLLLFA